jgi:UDP-glucuronate 4-epimerase
MTAILVTGAAGFIGYHVARRLLIDGATVHGVDNLSPYYDVSLKEARLRQLEQMPCFRFERMDLADREAAARLFRELSPRTVIHVAAQAGVRHSLRHPEDYIESNLVGFGNVLEGCRHAGTEHLVYASSSSVYGANSVVPFSTQHGVDHPVSLYAATKRANELMAHAYSHVFGLPTTGLRFFTVYGPWGRPDMAAFIFTKALFEGRPIDVYNGGELWRDFTYIDDVVEGVVRIAAARPVGGTATDDPSRSSAPFRLYNIGNHRPVRVAEFLDILERLTGKTALRRALPMQLGDVPYTSADVSDLVADVGFMPDTPLEEGLARFVAWYRDYYGVAA